MIAEILDRDNYVARQSPHNKRQQHIIASNLDQSILLATLKSPKTSQGFIDRFLPNGSASVVSTIAKACKRFQSGFIFDYTFIIITGFTLFITIIFYISVS
jgi:hypothetical protein